MAVQVDVCEAQVTCFDNLCGYFARLGIQDGAANPRPYCLDCAESRLGVHRGRGTQIVYTDAAQELLKAAFRQVIT